MLFSFSRAADMARSFRLIVQLHRLIHIGKWKKKFRQVTPSQMTYVEAEEFRASAEKGPLPDPCFLPSEFRTEVS